MFSLALDGVLSVMPVLSGRTFSFSPGNLLRPSSNSPPNKLSPGLRTYSSPLNGASSGFPTTRALANGLSSVLVGSSTTTAFAKGDEISVILDLQNLVPTGLKPKPSRGT